MFNLKNTFVAAALSLATVGSASASEWIMDDFNYDPVTDITDYNTSNNSILALQAGGTGYIMDVEESPHGNVVAGLKVNANTNSLPFFAAAASASTGSLNFAMGGGVDATLGLFYSDFDGSTGLDLTQGGTTDSFYFDVSDIDQSFTLDLYVVTHTDFENLDQTDANNNFIPDAVDPVLGALFAGGNFNVAALLGLDGVSHAQLTPDTNVDSSIGDDPITLSKAFADFDIFAGVVGATFSNVHGIFALINTNTGATDLVVDQVGTIPEPTTLAIFGLGLLGLGVARRRNA
jgi:hypothetical protein